MPDDAVTAFSSLEEMLGPGTLSRLLGRTVRVVRREALEPAGWSSTDAWSPAWSAFVFGYAAIDAPRIGTGLDILSGLDGWSVLARGE